MVASALSGPGSAPWLLEWKPPGLSLSCSARQIRVECSHWERSQSISLLELFTSECALLCCLPLIALIHKAHHCWPHLNLRMPVVGLGVPQLLFSQVYQHGSTGTVVVMHLDPLWELLRQFRLWPSPAPMHMPCGSPHCPLGCLTDVESIKLVLEV